MTVPRRGHTREIAKWEHSGYGNIWRCETCDKIVSPDFESCRCCLSEIEEIELYAESEARKEIENAALDAYISLCSNTEHLRPILDFQFKILVEMKKPKRAKQIQFITINPKPDIDIEQFKALVEKLLEKTYMVNPQCQFEQTGTDIETMGQHPHCHIIIDKTIRKSKILQFIYQLFKKYVGSQQSIDIKEYNDSMKQDKIDYMNGNKWDEDKEQACIINQAWRDKHGLNQIKFSVRK